MRILVDTNILVSGLLSVREGPLQTILRAILLGRLHLSYDGRVLKEYADVLRRSKFPFAGEDVDYLLERIVQFGEPCVSRITLNRSLPDPKDNAFLEIALSAGADHLVTGNLKHFPPPFRAGPSVISASGLALLLTPPARQS